VPSDPPSGRSADPAPAALSPLLLRAARLILLLAGAVAIAWLIREVGPGAIWSIFRRLGWRLGVLLCFPFAVAVLLDTLGWQVLLRDHRVPFLLLVSARLAGEAVNLTTPTASVGGEPLKAYLLRPHVPLAEGLASVVVDKTTVVAGQVLFLAAGISIAVLQLPPSSALVISMAVLLGIQILCTGGFVMVQTLGVFGGGGRFLGRIGVGSARQFQHGLDSMDDWLRRFYRERRARLAASILLHAAAWATGGLEIYLVLVFLGVDASAGAALAIEAFGSAVKFASFMIPGSLGALEGGYVAFFKAFDLVGAVGLSYTLIRRLREVAWAAVGYVWLASLRARPPLPGEWADAAPDG
jgi:glycosyltransferase 2 family protein